MQHSNLNGYPSWPEVYDLLDRGLTRIHQRIDDTQVKIDDVRVEVITIKATLAAQPRPPEPRGRMARLKAWAELIAPLRELMLMACVALMGLAALLQAPEVKATLEGMAARLAVQKPVRTSD